MLTNMFLGRKGPGESYGPQPRLFSIHSAAVSRNAVLKALGIGTSTKLLTHSEVSDSRTSDAQPGVAPITLHQVVDDGSTIEPLKDHSAAIERTPTPFPSNNARGKDDSSTLSSPRSLDRAPTPWYDHSLPREFGQQAVVTVVRSEQSSEADDSWDQMSDIEFERSLTPGDVERLSSADLDHELPMTWHEKMAFFGRDLGGDTNENGRAESAGLPKVASGAMRGVVDTATSALTHAQHLARGWLKA